MSDKPKNYTICPAFVRYDCRLKYLSRLLITEILLLSQNENKYCYITCETWARWYGVNRATISRCLKNLEESGYITIRRKKRNGKFFKNYIYVRKWVLQKCTQENNSRCNFVNSPLQNCRFNTTRELIQDTGKKNFSEKELKEAEILQNATCLHDAIQKQQSFEKERGNKDE